MTMACAENQPPAIAASANSEQDVLFFFFFFLRGTKSKLIKDTGSNGSGESASRAATAMQSLHASSLRVRNVVQIRGKQTAGIRQRRQLALSCARKRVNPSGLNASLRKKQCVTLRLQLDAVSGRPHANRRETGLKLHHGAERPRMEHEKRATHDNVLPMKRLTQNEQG